MVVWIGCQVWEEEDAYQEGGLYPHKVTLEQISDIWRVINIGRIYSGIIDISSLAYVGLFSFIICNTSIDK